MSIRSRQQPDDNQILAQIEEEAVEPRQAASVKKVLEEKTPAPVSDGTLGGIKGGKTRAAKLPANSRSLMARKAGKPHWKSHSLLGFMIGLGCM
jgi:hypothetical protein